MRPRSLRIRAAPICGAVALRIVQYIRHGGNRAFYSPSGDYVQAPPHERFIDGPRGIAARSSRANPLDRAEYAAHKGIRKTFWRHRLHAVRNYRRTRRGLYFRSSAAFVRARAPIMPSTSRMAGTTQGG